jgi:choline dehydrogenase-like flavoprotein
MMLDRGAADDYNNWEKLGNPGWGWTSLLPYFQKVCSSKSSSTKKLILK